MKNKNYLPILKGKKGEFEALLHLRKEQKEELLPLIEVVDIPKDYDKNSYKTTEETHLNKFIANIKKYWNKDNHILIDTRFLEEDNTSSLNYIIENLIKDDFQPVPVIGLNDSIKGTRIKELLAIRISYDDFKKININKQLKDISDSLSLEFGKVILIMDLGYIPFKEIEFAKDMALGIIKGVHQLNLFNDVFLNVTSFPIDLSQYKKGLNEESRIEVYLHQYIRSIEDSFDITPKFGDYTISNPNISDGIDPRFMNPTASIRYTYNDRWYILKGEPLKRGFDQFFDLSKAIVDNTRIYAGENYSWGDKEIFNKSLSEDLRKLNNIGTGNLTTWRSISINHHLVMTLNLLSNLV